MPLAPSGTATATTSVVRLEESYAAIICSFYENFASEYTKANQHNTTWPDGLAVWSFVWILFVYTIPKGSWVQFPVRPSFFLFFLFSFWLYVSQLSRIEIYWGLFTAVVAWRCPVPFLGISPAACHDVTCTRVKTWTWGRRSHYIAFNRNHLLLYLDLSSPTTELAWISLHLSFVLGHIRLRVSLSL